MSPPESPRWIPAILSQHAEEAAFLWLLRSSAISEPHYTLQDLARLDDRVEAHLDGLRIGADPAWEIAKENLGQQELGEVFAASNLAIEAKDPERLAEVFATIAAAPDERLERGLISALGWVSAQYADPVIAEGLGSEPPATRAWAIRASAVRRDAAFLRLEESAWRDHPSTEASFVRALGELGQAGRGQDCLALVGSSEVETRFWSAWSACLLGHRGGSVVTTLRELATSDFREASRALQLAGRAMPVADALSWHRELAADPSTRRQATQLAGAMGSSALLPWLLEQMADEALMRVAGESFSMITGLDLAYDDLDQDQPEGFEGGPNDDPADENVAMDDDENLPWPSLEGLTKWYEGHARDFDPDRRYLAGHAIRPDQPEALIEILKEGLQRQRSAAALERVLLAPGTPLFETRACGLGQRVTLGLPPR